MNDPTDPVFVATYGVSADALLLRHPDRVRDVDTGMILRSVLMKPENEANIEHLHRRLEELLMTEVIAGSGQNSPKKEITSGQLG